jgi:hypothetical protein
MVKTVRSGGVAWCAATGKPEATTDTMNTYIRHLLTFLAGIGTILAAKGIIPADQAATVNESGGQLIGPLAIIIGIVAVGVARAVIAWVQKWFGKPDDGGLFVHPATFALSAVLAVAAAVLLGACTVTEADAKSGTVTRKTEFLPPAAFWEALGNLTAKDNGGTIPVVKVRAEK